MTLSHHRRCLSPRRRAALVHVILASVLAVTALAPATALADGSAVINDCAVDSKLNKSYSPKEYKDALKNIPTDVDEYTDCRDVIRRAQLARAGGGTGTDSGGGPAGTAGAAGGAGSGGGSGPSSGGTATGGLRGYDAAIAGATPQERTAFDKAAGGASGVLVAGRDLRPDALSHGNLGTLSSLPSPLVIVLLLLGLGALTASLPTLRSVVRRRRRTV